MTDGKTDVAYVLADYAAKVKYEDIPEEAVDITKKDILDVFGTALAGSTADGIKLVHDLVVGWGGTEESSILSFGGKVPSVSAAFVNGTAAHARDYDDTHGTGVVHAGASAIPACLAMAEAKGRVTGKDFMTAIAMGIDLMSRLGMAARDTPVVSGWHNTAIFGVFGSAGACGRLLGFNVDKMIDALGIAYSQCAGTLQCLQDGALVKRMHAGFAARGAVLAALLADRGYTGAHNIFEGKYGLFNVYYDGYNKEALLSDLGKRFEVTNLHFKPYPCCRGNHASIDAALMLATEHNISPWDIEKIVVHHGKLTMICLEPAEAKRKPHDVVDAQFSIPYCVSRAFIQRKVGLSDFTPEAVREQVVLELAQKVETHFIPELTVQKSYEPVILDVYLTGNRVYSKRIDFAKGDTENPMSWAELCSKFRDCAHYSVKRLTESDIDKVIELVRNIEKVSSISEIVRLLA